jgi:hypothetical protein
MLWIGLQKQTVHSPVLAVQARYSSLYEVFAVMEYLTIIKDSPPAYHFVDPLEAYSGERFSMGCSPPRYGTGGASVWALKENSGLPVRSELAFTLGLVDTSPTFARSFLLAISTLCSKATMMFLSAPYLKLSATTFESYCYYCQQHAGDLTHLDLIVIYPALFQAAEIP